MRQRRGNQAADLARALGYERSDEVARLYRRHRDEFTSTMTQNAKVVFSGNLQKTIRLFSLRGAHLIAMLARTPTAKAFRRWALDILDALHNGGEHVMRMYRQAHQELEEGKEVASDCGRGLNQWKRIKRPLEQRLEYWGARRQLALELS